MERRRSKRIHVRMDAEIISGDANYSGIVENISEHGLCLETDSKDLLGKDTRFNPGTEFRVKFKIQSGEQIRLHCKVTWSYSAAPQGLKRKIGMEIIFPPPAYVDFYRNVT